MDQKNLTQAINWETIVTIYEKDYEKACEVWENYRHLFLFEMSSDFTMWSIKLNCSINDLYRVYNQVLDNLKNMNEKVNIVIYGDKDWPSQINNFPYPTKVLYYIGNIELLKKNNVAIVGSKNPKKENVEKLDKIVSSFVKSEILITSGLSLGTQGHAAYKSISNFSPVIAVLATSLDHYYPKEHSKMQDYIASESGLVITRFAPGENSNLKWNVFLRNRLMCALSKALFILEEVDGGGAIQLADYSLEHNGKVYFFSTLKKDLSLSWPTTLISKGAKAVRYPSEIAADIYHKTRKPKKIEEKVDTGIQLTLFDL